MLSRFAESDIRPALLGQVEINPCRCNVDQTVAVIQREVVMRFTFKVAEHLFILAFDPSRRSNIDWLKLTLNLVFISQSMRDNLKLKRPNRAKNQVIIAHRPEQLGSAFFTQLRQPLLQCFQSQWVF